MQAPAEFITTAAWASAVAVAAPVLARQVPGRILPIIVAELLLGAALGRSGLGWVPEGPVLATFTLLGFATLMFVSGIEVDLRVLLPRSGLARDLGPRYPIAWSVAVVLATFAVSTAGAWALWHDSRPWSHILFLACTLSTTSVGIVVPTLKERGLLTAAYGQILLAGAILADLLTMLFVSMLAAWIEGGEFGAAFLPLAFLALATVLGVVLERVGAAAPVRAYGTALDTATGPLPLRAAFALLFGFSLLAAQLHAEMVLAAFLAGMVAGALSPRGAPLRGAIERTGYGLLIPMFFFGVGATFDLPALLASTEALIVLPLLLVIAYANKLAPMLALKRYYPWPQVIGGGLLLSARLSLIIAAAAIGLRIGVFDAAWNAAMILVAVVTAIVSPVLFNIVSRGEKAC